MNLIEQHLRETVAKHVEGFVDGLEAVGLRRDLVLDGMADALKRLQAEQDAKPN